MDPEVLRSLLVAYKEAKERLQDFVSQHPQLISTYEQLQKEVEGLNKQVRSASKELPKGVAEEILRTVGFSKTRVTEKIVYKIDTSRVFSEYKDIALKYANTLLEIKPKAFQQLIQLGELPEEAQEILDEGVKRTLVLRNL